jgi:hypothetical protein
MIFSSSQFADKPVTVSFNKENLQIMIVIMNILKTYRLTLESNHPLFGFEKSQWKFWHKSSEKIDILYTKL